MSIDPGDRVWKSNAYAVIPAVLPADRCSTAKTNADGSSESSVQIDRRVSKQPYSRNSYRPAGRFHRSHEMTIEAGLSGSSSISNELPRLADTSGALASRFIVIRLVKSFYGREDQRLTERLILELPGILNWAIEGLRRARGYFVQPASAAEAVQELEDSASPIGAFLREMCVIKPDATVSVTRLFEAWCEWCKTQGRDHPGTAQTFGRDLRAAVPAVKTVYPRDASGRRRIYQGVGLRW